MFWNHFLTTFCVFCVYILLECPFIWPLFFNIRQHHAFKYGAINETIHNSTNLINYHNPLLRETIPEMLSSALGVFRIQPSEFLKLDLDSSKNNIGIHFWTVQLRVLATSSLVFLFSNGMQVFIAGLWLNNPASKAFLLIVLSPIFKSNRFRSSLEDAVGSF